MRYAILVTGPAGSGKSTFCSALMTHAQAAKRRMHLFNLDPAAEEFAYEPSIDIRDLISLEDVMEEMEMGPNGGLVYCFEYLMENLDWLHDSLGEFEDDYLLIDCPGQIELYTHIPILPSLINILTSSPLSFSLCRVYLLESQFIQDINKYFSGVLSAMAAMASMECPTLNLISKMDLVDVSGKKKGKKGRKKRMEEGDEGKVSNREMERYLEADPSLLYDEANASTSNTKWQKLNQSIVDLIAGFSMVNFLPLDASDEDSMELVLSHIDNVLQYGEHEEPKEPKDMDSGDFEAMDE
ncbi:GPN-loop GTPase 3 like protein [Atractiella rhizophila]|nr:GPN-loop GTPase 3 like protein [Atractiella rhizophila]